ncbi:MAG: thioredoxin family protein [Bacteroidota bacterium]
MKKITSLLTGILVICALNGFSQNRSIFFIEKPFSELMTMAKSQNKMIFVDAYTSWCGPCKWMAANMFTKDSVADYYNKTFICAHFDMEKGEGPELARTFQVMAYPTLLFINANGELVHKRVGAAQQVQDYIRMGTDALTPGEGFVACLKKFQDGNRDPDFMLKYFDRLQGAYMPIDEPLALYFSTQKETDLLKRSNWHIIYLYLSDIGSKEFTFLLAHRKEYAKAYTPDSVDAKIYSICFQSLVGLARGRTFSETALNEMKQKIRATGYEGGEKAIFDAQLQIYLMRGDQQQYFDLVTADLEKYYGDDQGKLTLMASNFAKMTTDKKYLEKGVEWAKKAIAIKSTPENNDACANLLFKLGNKEDAIKYEMKAVEIATKLHLPVAAYEASLKRFRQ